MALGAAMHVAGLARPRRSLYVADLAVLHRAFVAASPDAHFSPQLAAAHGRVAVRSRVVHLVVVCTDSWRAVCRGHIELLRRGARVAVVRFAVAPGTSHAFGLRLTPAAWRVLRRTGRYAVKAFALSRGVDRVAATAHRGIDLRLTH